MIRLIQTSLILLVMPAWAEAQARVAPSRPAPSRSPSVQRAAPSRARATPAPVRTRAPVRSSAPVRSAPPTRNSSRSFQRSATPVRPAPSRSSRSYTPPARSYQPPTRSYSPPRYSGTTVRRPSLPSRSSSSSRSGTGSSIRRWEIGGSQSTGDRTRVGTRQPSFGSSSPVRRYTPPATVKRLPITSRYRGGSSSRSTGAVRTETRRNWGRSNDPTPTPPRNVGRGVDTRSPIDSRSGTNRTRIADPGRTGDLVAPKTPARPPIVGRYGGGIDRTDARRVGTPPGDRKTLQPDTPKRGGNAGGRADRIDIGGDTVKRAGALTVAPEPRRRSSRTGRTGDGGPRRSDIHYRTSGYGYDLSYRRYCYPYAYYPWRYDCYSYWPRWGFVSSWFPSWCNYWWRGWWTSCWVQTYGSLWSDPWYDPYYCYASYYPASSSIVVVREPYLASDPIVEAVEEEPVDRSSPESLARYYVELGDLYFKTRRYLRAAEAYTRAVRMVPEDGSLRFVQADAWFAIEEYDKAAYAIRQGLTLDPSLAEAMVDKRDYYGELSDFEKHMANLRSHLGKRPFDTQARLVLAYNLRFSGQFDEAKAQLEKLSSHLPGDMATKQLLDGLEKVLAERAKDAAKGSPEERPSGVEAADPKK